MPDIVIVPDSGLINFYYSDTNNPIATAVVSGENLVFLSQSGQINIQDLKVSGSLDTSSLSTTSSVNTSDYLLVEQNGFINRSTVTNAQYKFPSDLTVSLTNNRTFGRYVNGSVIPASGKTPAEVINLAIVEPINPSGSLTSTTTIPLNQTSINNALTFSHTINSLNATVSSASLEWRRDNIGAWAVLSSGTSANGTYNHIYTDSAFNIKPFNYRYIVVDSVGASGMWTKDITPFYNAPTISLIITGPDITSAETNIAREKGNVSTTLSGSITRNSTYVNLTNYVIQYSVNNNASWTNIGSLISISSSPHTIAATGHNPTADKTASNIRYRISVTDQFQTTISSISTINFYNMIFYGPYATDPTTSNDIRLLPNKVLNISANPITFNTGSTDKYYSIVLPSGSSSPFGLLTQAFNTTNNFDTTSQFNLYNVSVNDYGLTATSYRRYTHAPSAPYSNNNFNITRS